MLDLRLLDHPTDAPGLPEWRRPAHPVLVGLACMALAAAGWHGLLWRSSHPVRHEAAAQLRAPVEEAALPPESAMQAVALADSVVPPSEARHAAVPREAASTTPLPSSAAAATDPTVSPFRRSHPWAAVPGQPYYYPSHCPATLRFPDLQFFRTEREARAGGYVPAPDSGCG